MSFSDILGTIIAYLIGIGFFVLAIGGFLGVVSMAFEKPKKRFEEFPDKIIFTFRDETVKPHTPDSGQTPGPAQAAPQPSAPVSPTPPYEIRYPKAWEVASSDQLSPSREEKP